MHLKLLVILVQYGLFYLLWVGLLGLTVVEFDEGTPKNWVNYYSLGQVVKIKTRFYKLELL